MKAKFHSDQRLKNLDKQQINQLDDAWAEVNSLAPGRSEVYEFTDDGVLTIAVTDAILLQRYNLQGHALYASQINAVLGRYEVKKIKFWVLPVRRKRSSQEQESSPERLIELRTMPYQQYLDSPEWKKKSREKRNSNPQCQLCNFPNKLHVHHRTYERRGQEDDSDLTVLCAECHELFHTHSELYVESEKA